MNHKLKGNVTLRTKADAAERLDQYLAEQKVQNPGTSIPLPEVTAAALHLFCDVKAGLLIVTPAPEAQPVIQAG